MAKVKRREGNKWGLSGKQRLVVEDYVREVKASGRGDLRGSHRKFYGGEDKNMRQLVYQNLRRDNFRLALIDGLRKGGIIGKGGKVERRLMEGLDAVRGRVVDYRTRLDYVKEINKVTDVYPAVKVDQRRMNLNLDLSAKDLERKIKEIQGELGV